LNSPLPEVPAAKVDLEDMLVSGARAAKVAEAQYFARAGVRALQAQPVDLAQTVPMALPALREM